MDRFSCNSCTYVREVVHRHRSYVFPDGAKLQVRQQFAWCHSCSDVVSAEWLDDLDHIRDALAAAQARDQSKLRWTRPEHHENLESFFTRKIGELAQRLRWRLGRIGLSRCLECGSGKIDPFPYRQDHKADPDKCGCYVLFGFTLPHPGCGGLLFDVAHRGEIDGPEVLHTPEGQLL